MTRVKKVCATAGVDHVLLDTSKPLDGVLSSYLNFRGEVTKEESLVRCVSTGRQGVSGIFYGSL